MCLFRIPRDWGSDLASTGLGPKPPTLRELRMRGGSCRKAMVMTLVVLVTGAVMMTISVEVAVTKATSFLH